MSKFLIPTIWKDAAQTSWDLYLKSLDMPLPDVSEQFTVPTIEVRKTTMRVEFIQCDMCEKKHDAEYVLPREWIRTIQNTSYDGVLQEECHFCSRVCLVKWAAQKELEKKS